MRFWSLTVLAVVGTALAACGGDEEEPIATGLPMGGAEVEQASAAGAAGNRAPEIKRLTLDPENPVPGERITADVEASDPDGDPVQLTYEWRVNGQRAGGGPTLHTQGHPKGTYIELQVVPNDGQTEGPAATESAQVGNQPPVMLGIVIEPLGEVSRSHDIAARAQAMDPDGDELEFSYVWTINGDDAYSNEAILPKDEFKRGDEITLTVLADDGSDESEPLESAAFAVVNALPVVTSSPGAFDEDGSFRYQVEVSDPDGDRRLRYRLLEGPKGMELDLLKGKLVWAPAETQAGTHPVKLEVDDMAGGKVTQSFQVNVGFGDTPASQAD